LIEATCISSVAQYSSRKGLPCSLASSADFPVFRSPLHHHLHVVVASPGDFLCRLEDMAAGWLAEPASPFVASFLKKFIP